MSSKATNANDDISGKATNDTIDAKRGDDILRGAGGNDTLIGGEGNDQMSGGAGADDFRFYGDQISGTDTDKIYDLNFSDGDSLTFSHFGEGVFADAAGGLGLDVSSNGSSVSVHSVAELAELVHGSQDVTASRKGTTDVLILTVKDADGNVQNVHISNAYDAFMAAGNVTPPAGTGSTDTGTQIPPTDTGSTGTGTPPTDTGSTGTQTPPADTGSTGSTDTETQAPPVDTDTQHIVNVSNGAELAYAITHLTADTVIVLAAGDYGTLNIKNSDTYSVTLKAADSDHPPSFTGVTVTSSKDVHLDGLHFTAIPGMDWSAALTIRNSQNVTVEHSKFEGGPDAYADGQRGIYVDGSSGVIVNDNTIEGFVRGALFQYSSNLTITNNSLHHLQTDGFNFVGVTNVEVAHNHMKDFYPAPWMHPDFVQFWTDTPTSGSKNISIHDNVFLQGNGLAAQGVLMGNNAHIPYENVSIKNNVINTSMPNGIAVYDAYGVDVSDNVAVSVASSSYKVGIKVYGSTDVVFQSNVADVFDLRSGAILVSGNLLTDGIGAGAESADRLWTPSATAMATTTQEPTTTPTTTEPPATPEPTTTESPTTEPTTSSPSSQSTATVLNGTDANDDLSGKASNDIIDTKRGNDILRAGSGNDTLIGGEGDDQLSGAAGADEFRFYGGEISSTDTDKIYDLKFGEGDSLAFDQFGAGVFIDRTGGLDLDVSNGGSSAVVNSFAEVAELVRDSDHVTATRKSTTDVLILTIKDIDGDVENVHISNAYNSFIAAGGVLNS